MVDKFCLRIFSSHEVPKLWEKFHFLGGKSVITDWRNLGGAPTGPRQLAGKAWNYDARL